MNGIRRKIRRAMLLVTACTIVLITVAFFGAFHHVFKSIVSRDEKIEETIERLSSDRMIEQITRSREETDTKETDMADVSRLMEKIDAIRSEGAAEADRIMQHSVVILFEIILLIILIVILAALRLSHRIADPINRLTARVSSIKGETLDFVWEEDTGDETQLLADSFQNLVERIKQHIAEVQEVTAQKERIEAELTIGAKIQAAMLPRSFPAFPDRTEFDIYASMSPAREVGGDFYDFFLIDQDHLAIVIGDVSEKGVPAALFMVISKTLIRDQAQLGFSPGKVLEKVNRSLCEGNDEGMFVTVWLGIMEIRSGRITAANAGHEYPAIRGRNGRFQLFKEEHDVMLGVMNDNSYAEYEMKLAPGEALFVYTDGVPEAADSDKKFYGTGRMIEALNQDPLAKPMQLLKNVEASVNAFVGKAPRYDDLTMLAVMRRNDDK